MEETHLAATHQYMASTLTWNILGGRMYKPKQLHKSHSLQSSKEDYTGKYYRGFEGDARSLGYSSHDCHHYEFRIM